MGDGGGEWGVGGEMGGGGKFKALHLSCNGGTDQFLGGGMGVGSGGWGWEVGSGGWVGVGVGVGVGSGGWVGVGGGGGGWGWGGWWGVGVGVNSKRTVLQPWLLVNRYSHTMYVLFWCNVYCDYHQWIPMHTSYLLSRLL